MNNQDQPRNDIRSTSQWKTKRLLLLIMIAFTIPGCILLGMFVLIPHHAGTVVSVELENSYTRYYKSGDPYKVYHAIVLVEDIVSRETVSIDYHENKIEYLPSVGDHVEYTHNLFGSIVPAPDFLLLGFGIAFLAMAAIFLVAYIAYCKSSGAGLYLDKQILDRVK